MKTAGLNQQLPKHRQEIAPVLDPVSYTSFKENTYRDNLTAWDSVKFRRPANEWNQYLDVGCGTGNFLKEHQLPRLRPCRRVVATDCSRDMLEYARSHTDEPEVTFELFDIERGDPQTIVDKYGEFDRLYAFLTFQYVWDLTRAYRSVYQLLKDGGECLIVYFTRTAVTDVWHRVHQMEEWRNCMRDPSALFAERFRFDATVTDDELVADETRAAVAAGLDMVDCHTQTTQWTFSSADTFLDTYIPFYKLDVKVPTEKRPAFRDAWRCALLEASTAATDGISFRFDLIVAHLQKPVSGY